MARSGLTIPVRSEATQQSAANADPLKAISGDDAFDREENRRANHRLARNCRLPQLFRIARGSWSRGTRRRVRLRTDDGGGAR
jgi:hypothetical protein